MLAFLTVLPEPQWVQFYTVAFGTGLRPSEQYALQWEHVDFPRRLLHIRQGYVKGQVTTLKTAGSHRDAEILPHVEEALRAQHNTAHASGR
ncbi:MAG: hypothetical protein AB7N91_29875 [Candidatus Tectimicrobiota bacterium]